MPISVLAQEEQPASNDPTNNPDLLVFTTYPSQVIGVDEENVSLDLTLRTNAPRIVNLEVQNTPEEWDISFRGDSRVVDAVYVDPTVDATVSLRVEPPADVEVGTYNFTVLADSEAFESALPIALTVNERVPPRLAFDADLPTLRGEAANPFTFNVTLNNEGGEDLTVDLLAQAPEGFRVNFQSSGQDVTNLPVEANSSASLSVEATALFEVPAGSYPIQVQAQSAEIQTSIDLTAEVIGATAIALTTVDERLSGEAYIGQEASYNLILENTGSAPATGIELSSTPPSGWNVTFEPPQVEMIEPGQRQEVTARVTPADTAIAGDYVVTFRAQPAEATAQSIEYRVTVLTSTLWGIVGIVLIAIAVGVVGLAVVRFGRR